MELHLDRAVVLLLLLAFCQFAGAGASQFETKMRCETTFNEKYGNFTHHCDAETKKVTIHWFLSRRISGLMVNGTISVRKRSSNEYVSMGHLHADFCQLISGQTYVGFVTIFYNMARALPNRHIVERCPIEPVRLS